MGIRRGIFELHQFQSALAREYNAAHRFLRLFLLVGYDLERKKRGWQSANQWRAGMTKDCGVPLLARHPLFGS
jgi:hypothetical protein